MHFGAGTLQLAALALLLTIGLTEVFGHVPQTYRLYKHRNSSGLSALSLLVGLSDYLLWNVYYVSKDNMGLLLVNAIATFIYATLVVGAGRAGLPLKKPALYSLGYIGLTLVLFHFSPLTLPAILLAGAAVMFFTACLGAWKSESLAGISAATWVGLLTCGVASLLLGLIPGEGDPAIAAWGAIATCAALFVLALVALDRREPALAAVEPPAEACGDIHQEDACLCA